MVGLKQDISALLNRGLDRHLRLAVTGLSRSGKTAFITSFVNQLLMVNQGARLPLFSAAREGRLLGARRVPQRNLGLSRFTYDEGIAALFGTPPNWPTPTRGVSEMRLALRYRPRDALWRHFKETGTLYLEIVDYPGEWLLDLPMLEQDYLTWSRQMGGLLQGERAELARPWLERCASLDPSAPADERALAETAHLYTDYLLSCKQKGLHFIQPGRFVLPGEMAGAPALQFFPWPQASVSNEHLPPVGDRRTNLGMLRARYQYYCQTVVKQFYKQHFTAFDRQIVLVDCLQPLNRGPDAFNDMRLALTQLMRSFHYGKRSLFRRLFSPCIDKLMFAASKTDHVTPDQQANQVSLLRQLVQDASRNAAFEGIAMDYAAVASVRATQNGRVTHQGQEMAALKGFRLPDNQPLTCYPGEVPSRLPGAAFWQQQGFQFEEFLPPAMDPDAPLPHIRLDAAMEFLLGDKLR